MTPILLPAPVDVNLFAQRMPFLPDWRGILLDLLNKLDFTRPQEVIHRSPTLDLSIFIDTKPKHPQGYWLEIKASQNKPEICIRSQTKDGLRNGCATLRQILLQSEDHLPTVVIDDYPAFEQRGVMLDISRDRVPLMPDLLHTVDDLAALKINCLQLYTEHTFAYKTHQIVWRYASPITPTEIQQLDAYCLSKGITLMANQNCFGHLERWLKHPEYIHLAETTGQWQCLGRARHGPFSLCPIDPRSVDFIENLLQQLLPNFASHIVNIGCDETFDVGQGRSKAAVEEYGFAKIYADFIDRIQHIASENDFASQFWSDIALSHPEALDYLSKDLTALVWGYEPDAPFEKWCETLQAKGFQYWVCPGTSAWRSITGRTYERMANIQAAVQQGLKSDAKGCLITDWGDDGHRQQWPVSLIGLTEGAARTWNCSVDPNPQAISLFAFGDASGKTAMWLNDLGDADLEIRRAGGSPNSALLRNASALFIDLRTPLQSQQFIGSTKQWQNVFDRLKDLSKTIPTNIAPIISAELEHTLAVALFAAERAVERRKQKPLSPALKRKFCDALQNIIAEHKRLWLNRSRPGGLADSAAHYEKILQELQC